MARLRGLSPGWLAGGVVLALLLLLPLAVGTGQLGLPTEVFMFAMFALTYDLIFGFTGLISFGHALFVGFGAYTLAISMTSHNAPLCLALVITLLVGILVSAITGALALRTRGVYFAMVTLAFAQAALTLDVSDIGNLTGGDNGIGMTGGPDWLTGPSSQTHFYYVALACLVVTFLLLRLFVLSLAGRVWQAVRENEQRALVIGYHPFPFKLLSYVIAGAVTSLAGALYALYVGTVSPSVFAPDLTIRLLLMVIIGGAGSLWGAILGAAIVHYLDHYLNVLATSDVVTRMPSWLHQTLGQPLLLFGIIYLLLVYFFPQGIAGLVQRYLPVAASPAPRPGLGEVEARAAVAAAGDEAPTAESTAVETTPRG